MAVGSVDLTHDSLYDTCQILHKKEREREKMGTVRGATLYIGK